MDDDTVVRPPDEPSGTLAGIATLLTACPTVLPVGDTLDNALCAAVPRRVNDAVSLSMAVVSPLTVVVSAEREATPRPPVRPVPLLWRPEVSISGSEPCPSRVIYVCSSCIIPPFCHTKPVGALSDRH